MQPSPGTFFRVVIMLVCLVVVPLVALFGGQMPDVAKDFLRDRLAALTEKLGGSRTDPTAIPATPLAVPTAAATALSDPPVFAPQWNERATPPASPTPLVGNGSPQNPPFGTLTSPTALDNNRNPGVGNPSAPLGAVPVNYEERLGGTGPTSNPRAGGMNPTGPPQASFPSSLATGTPSVGGERLPASPSPLPGAEDRFPHYQRRLRELGVSYYLLETWGDQGQLFRFYCRLTVGGNPACTRYFDAVDAEPLTAIAKVLQQVEAWRTNNP